MSPISADDVHQALLCLYSPAELAGSRLAELLPEVSRVQDPVERAQLLRGRLLDAIELLRPAARAAPAAVASRAYDCLRLRYVSGLKVDEVARSLAVSPRQAYRDLGWAEEQLSVLLGSQRPPAEAAEPEDAGVLGLQAEIQALAHKPTPVRLMAVVESAIATVAPLAEKAGVSLHPRFSGGDPTAAVTPALLREVLTLLLSALVQSPPSADIEVTVGRRGKSAFISVPLRPPHLMPRYDLVRAALEVARAQGFRHELVETEAGMTLELELPLAKGRQVLVVEDNPGASALYQRYLATSEWEPINVPHPRLSVDWAATHEVDAVILDIMMTELDGWSVLRGLRSDPRTESLPVIVCSVLNDPELAQALGATACLTKPISRLDLLKTLRQAAREGTPASDAPDRPE